MITKSFACAIITNVYDRSVINNSIKPSTHRQKKQEIMHDYLY